MATRPGSGAVIIPVFNRELGVDSVIVKSGGSGYSAQNPPVLVIKNCGLPVRDAALKPIISKGKIVSVQVLDPGEGYDPLRVKFFPQIPEDATELPEAAEAQAILKEDGSLDYVKIVKSGDNQFYNVDAEIIGGEGSGASLRAVPRTVTGLTILNEGRGYEEPPFLSISGGGGRGARGVALVDRTSVVSPNFTISNPGQFYIKEPYIILVGGGGLGAKARAIVDQGQLIDIVLENPGRGYTSPPRVVFARKVKLKKISRNRQSYNLEFFNLSGLTLDASRDDIDLFVSSTTSFPGSGVVLLGSELIRYTGKDQNRLTGCTRGLNFRYDQRVVLDNTQDDEETGISTYNFNIGDRLIRSNESSDNRIAIVYDWDPIDKELFVIFEVDELAFIDAGLPGESSNVIFDAGISDSSGPFDLPHTIIPKQGSVIFRLTVPRSVLTNVAFQDIAELDGQGDGLPDLINTGTSYENETNLDGGIPETLYGIEETQGGQNTTLFQVGDKVRDSSVPFKTATVVDASNLNEGIDHFARLSIKMDTRNPSYYNGINFVVGETVIGNNTQIQATVESWDPNTRIVTVRSIIPYDTQNPDIGFVYKFSENGTVVSARIISGGNNYTSAPTIQFQSNSIQTASATAVMLADQVNDIIISDGGYGYTTPPQITFSGGGGSGAIAQAILGGELLIGQNGASWRILSIDYDTQLRDDKF
jgi:hypothetical protein